MDTLNVLSLFAGIGGLDLGLERAGLATVGQVELDPFCRTVLARHFPEVPRHDDVRTTPAWWRSRPRPRVHVVAGGFPCQPFSNAGRMLGIADPRWMWPAMAAVVRLLRPDYVLVENVAALVRDADAFGIVLGDLAALGFDAEWALLHASAFGAPTPRERLYLLAYPPSVDGQPRDLLEPGRIGGSPLAAGGLPGLPAHQLRRAARDWLAREPRVDRLVDGVPDQVDRLRAIGNAVVPAVAQHLGQLILADHAVRVPAAAPVAA
ncbi:DNA cytosine methyltransferase [Amycolatopsis benzoatilytica]|uniref:DNA cytosine methyltransferase n=1 Tax=Amycolatopsis benzoatilytica TaxID=346045 RepID=UPI000381AF66|nr:DNA (cytosine-5-)-methyltransferase [Amycolatopsis benzoatilytica]